jgi:hypothetical protein
LLINLLSCKLPDEQHPFWRTFQNVSKGVAQRVVHMVFALG